MKIRLLPTPILFLVVSLSAPGQGADSRFSDEEKRQGFSNRTLLAKPRATADAMQVDAAERAEGTRLVRSLPSAGNLRVLEPAAGETVLQAVARLRATARYEYVEPDYLVRRALEPNDPRFFSGEQWALRNTGQSGGKAGADIGAVAAWDVQRDARSVVVAIIDSGLRVTHEDISANLWVNPGESGGNRAANFLDDDNNGYVDDVNGINANAQRGTLGSGSPQDLDGHGTAVASVIGASGNNGRGMAGVAWNASLMGLRFIDASGFGTISDEVECIDYAIAKGAKIINASYAVAAFSQTSFEAHKRAREAGIIVVCAAGNEGENNDLTSIYPTGFLLDNIISVANHTRADVLSVSSNFGTGTVDLAAPGTSIVAASGFSNTGYVTISGTSFSAPMVSGAVALLRARFPTENHRAIINRLLRSVEPVPAYAGKTATGGRLNVNAAVRSTSVRPFNDDFATRATLVGERVTTRSSPEHATREAGEPAHAGSTSGNGSLWWTWSPTRTGPVVLDTKGSAFDTLLHVYTGPALGTLVSVASNDNESGALTTSRLTFNATAGTTYQIAVDAKSSATGLLVLALEQNASSDAFDSGQLVTGRSWSVTADNRNATRETGEPRIRNNAGGKSVWFRWVAPATRRYHLSTYSETLNTMIGVYTGTALTSLTEVTSSLNDGDSNFTTIDGGVTLNATAGTTYHIVVDSEAPSSGPLLGGTFKLSCTDSEWEFFGDGPIVTPSVAPNGNLHFIDDYGWIYAVDSDGIRRWRYEMTGYGTFSSPAVAPDGTVYGCDDFRYVHAVTPTGVRKWRTLLGGVIQASPAVAADGTVYVRADNGRLYALNPVDGTIRWNTDLGTSTSTSYTSPSIAPDGTIYCASAASRLVALNPDGTIKWTFNTDFFLGSPAIGSDGTLYIGCSAPTRRLYALRPNGTVLWEFIAGDTVSSSAVIGTDGTIYFGCADKKLYALNPAGDLRWALDTGGEIRNSSPIVASDGSIFVGSLDGKVHHVNPEGTLRRTFSTAGEVRLSPLLHNGRLYIPSYDGRLYAVNVGLVPASTAWPMHRQNVARSARTQHPTLAFGVQPAAQTAAIEERVTFVAGAVGTPPLAYQWSFNGATIAGATASTLRLDSVYHVNGGNYTVRVTDSTGAITSNPARLTISTPLVLPTVLTAPETQTVLVGTGVTLNVAANGTPPFTFQWNRDGAPISGATSSSLTLNDPRLTDTGQYSVTITNFGGSVTSTPVTLTINPVSRISNLSIRSQVGGAAGTLTVGLTVGGAGVSGAKPLLLRAIGPTLGAFGLTGVLADPQLAILSGQATVAQNDDWAGNANVASTSAAVGAFALSPVTSKDAALVHSPESGGYTVQIVGAANGSGVALAEVYDATPADIFVVSTPRLTNVSALTRAGTGADVLIAGFSIAGATPKTVLVRAIGPTLAAFGVGGVLADSRLELFANGATTPLATNDNWGSSANAAQIVTASASVGAFVLANDSRDAVLLVTLPPGSYTAQVSGVNNTSGVALVEVYDVP